MTAQGSIDFRQRLPSSEPLIHTLINAYMMSGALFTCTELDLFSYLDHHPGADLEDIAAHCRITTKQTRKLLGFGQSVGLVQVDRSGYCCSPEAARLLSRHSPHNLCAAMAHHQRHVYPLFNGLSDSMRQQTPICDRLGINADSEFYAQLDKREEEFQLFMEAMNIFSRGAGTRLAELIKLRAGNDRPLRILDLGGGGGQVATELAKHLPGAQIVLVDLDKAVRHAEAQVISQELHAHIECRVGDIFAPMPNGPLFDVVLLSAVLGDWSLPYQNKLLDNAYSQLRSGGLLVVSETLLDDDLGGPILPTLMNLYVQVLTEGGENFSAARLCKLLSDRKFHRIEVHDNRALGCRDTVIAERQ